MNKQTLAIGLIAIISLVNSTSEETSVEGPAKQKINFYGTLTTWQDKEYTIDNIAVGRKFKQIEFFEMPKADEANQTHHEIKKNPKNGILTRIDLAEICEIRTPQPDVVWKYQHNSRKIEYLQVTIVSLDGSTDKYLVETNRKVTCDIKKQGAPTELVVPFASIKNLVIKGYTLRESQNREMNNAANRCVASSESPSSLK